MIKHEEVREALGILLCISSLDMSCSTEIYEAYNTLEQYINEQEKKDELLNCYRTLMGYDKKIRTTTLQLEQWNLAKAILEVRDKIKELEEELK